MTISFEPHKKLTVWQTSVDLVTDVYSCVETLPRDERFDLVSQMRRCAVSVPANLAEGAARESRKEFLRYAVIARGSLSELDTYLEICRRIGYMQEDQITKLTKDARRICMMLNGLIKSLRTN